MIPMGLKPPQALGLENEQFELVECSKEGLSNASHCPTYRPYIAMQMLASRRTNYGKFYLQGS